MIRSRLRMRGGGGEPIPPLVLGDIDPPVWTALSSKTYDAFGFDRLVQGFSGNTVRVKRLSDNVQSDFGFDATGRFNYSGMTSWAGGADIDVVKFYSQKGTAAELVMTGTVDLVRSGVVKRFGTDWSYADGQLTRSATLGAVGANMGSAGAGYSTGLSISQSTNGLEIHTLLSHNLRKRDGTYLPDAYGGNSADAFMYSYEIGSFNVQHRTGGDFRDAVFVNGGSSNIILDGSSPAYKKFAQQVITCAITNTDCNLYDRGRKSGTIAYTSTNATGIPSGNLNNGQFYIGGIKGGTATSVSATNRAEQIFGGVVFTYALTDAERMHLKMRLSAVGQQHDILTATDFAALFDERLVFRNNNASTLVGESSKVTIAFNNSVVAEGTPNWNYAYTQPDVGITGVRSLARTGTTPEQANSFKATTNYYAGVSTGFWVSVHYSESSGNNLANVIVQGTGTGRAYENKSIQLGFDHGNISLETQIALSRDVDGAIGTRKKSDGSGFGAAVYDGANQAEGKYNFKTLHRVLTLGETFASHTWDAADWANVGDAPFLLDAPVRNHSIDSLTYETKDGSLIIQIGKFKAPSGYNRAASYATKKPMLLQADSWSIVTNGVNPIAHVDGAIARNQNSAVVDSTDDATIMTMNINNGNQPALIGSRFFAGFGIGEITDRKLNQIVVNLYKNLFVQP